MLIEPDSPNTLETVVVGEHLLAVLEYRAVDRVPPHPQVTGNERDRLAVLAHTAGCPGPGPLREHGSGADLRARLPPRTRWAGRCWQRQIRFFQLSTTGRSPIGTSRTRVRARPFDTACTPAVAAERTVRRGLDQYNELVLVRDGVEEDEPVESEKKGGRVGSVLHVCGLRIDGVEQPPIS